MARSEPLHGRRSALSSDGDAQTPPPVALTRRDGARVIVAVTGDLDLATGPELTNEVTALLASPLETITLDLTRLGFMDSSGIHALIEVHRIASERRVQLLLTRVPAQARRVLELTATADVFEYAD